MTVGARTACKLEGAGRFSVLVYRDNGAVFSVQPVAALHTIRIAGQDEQWLTANSNSTIWSS